jgi:probable HAF family extracellular repeat protein
MRTALKALMALFFTAFIAFHLASNTWAQGSYTLIQVPGSEYGNLTVTHLAENNTLFASSAADYYSGDARAFYWTEGSGIQPLGSFGGTQTAITAVNDAAMAVGYSTGANGRSYAFKWTRTGGLQALTPMTETRSRALDVNKNGVIAGDFADKAVIWTEQDGMIDLGSLPGHTSHTAHLINDNNLVVGYAFNPTTSGYSAFFWTQESGIVPLGDLEGGTGRVVPIAINNQGMVIGTSSGPGGWDRAFRWTPSQGMVKIETGQNYHVWPRHLNEAGMVALNAYNPFANAYKSFFWSESTGTLSINPSAVSIAESGMSENGTIVGTEGDAQSTTGGYVWSLADGYTPLALIPGTRYFPTDINANDQVAGYAYDGQTSRAFAWNKQSGIVDVGGDSLHSRGMLINNQGWLAGSVTLADYSNQIAVWKPGPQYQFSGFLQPIESFPALNKMKAGGAVPIKFNLGGNYGLDILLSPPSSQVASCAAGTGDPVGETVNAGTSSLHYDAATGTYVYIWKTDKSWANSCRILEFRFKDGSKFQAVFQFTR